MRKVIYWLRIAAQCASLLLITAAVLIYSIGYNSLSVILSEHWYYLATVIAMYALLTISEDYLNARALAPRL